MLLSNKFSWKIFLSGAVLNLIQAYFFYAPEITVLLFFVVGILINQLLLLAAISKLTSDRGSMSLTVFAIIAKLFVLLGVFYYAMSKDSISTYFLVYLYIFQLIILFISIKKKS